jgi:hypothetical protein
MLASLLPAHRLPLSSKGIYRKLLWLLFFSLNNLAPKTQMLAIFGTMPCFADVF